MRDPLDAHQLALLAFSACATIAGLLGLILEV